MINYYLYYIFVNIYLYKKIYQKILFKNMKLFRKAHLNFVQSYLFFQERHIFMIIEPKNEQVTFQIYCDMLC